MALETDPEEHWAQAMIGTRAGGGFRRHLARVAAAAYAANDSGTVANDSGTRVSRSASGTNASGTSAALATMLVRQLLEDLPAAALISGYSSLRLARRRGARPGDLTPPAVLEHMRDMCSGWRAEGSAAKSIAAGEGVPVQDCPVAPVLEGQGTTATSAAATGGATTAEWAWHTIPTLEADCMRRRRLVDVSFDDEHGASAHLWAMFRDTVGERDGSERVLHEYALTGRLERSERGMLLASVRAEPRVLPFSECPAAAAEVGALVGTAVSDLTSVVPEVLLGVSSCTHLNDLLRNVGGLAGLLAAS